MERVKSFSDIMLLLFLGTTESKREKKKKKKISNSQNVPNKNIKERKKK